MKRMRVEMPELTPPKKGGMLDAIRHGMFVEYLAGIDWQPNREQEEELDKMFSPTDGLSGEGKVKL